MPRVIFSKIRKANALIYPQHIFSHPEWLVFGVNNVCNLHCKMCDVGTQNNETVFAQNLVGTHPLNMPLELFKQVADEAHRYFPKVKLGYAFTEPLAYPHLVESLNYAKSKFLETYITTNALKLPQLAESLCHSGLKEIFISLDGLEATHNEIRGHHFSFQKAVEGIEKLISCKNPPKISIFCTITEWNVSELKAFADYFIRYPIAQIGFMHTNFTKNEIAYLHNRIWGNYYPATHSNVEQSDVSHINLELLLQQIQSLRKNNYPYNLSFSPALYTAEQLDVFYHQPEKIIGKVCNDAFSNIMIKSDGSVIPAHGRCYNVTVGNVYQQSLKEIWNSHQLSTFRKNLMKAGGLFPACSRCCSAF